MGNCCAADEYPGHDDEVDENPPHKILFLGSGGCGKSTFFRQLRKLHGQGFTDSDYISAKGQIAAFVIETMQKILLSSCKSGDDDEEYEFHTEFEDEALQKAAALIINIPLGQQHSIAWTPELVANITLLWAQQSVKDKFDETAKFNLNAACEHFFDSMDRISAADYRPTDTDILMQRRPTTGLIEEKVAPQFLSESGAQFLLIDVGGQKNERKKWIHHFENVSAVIYVVSLSAFDEPLYEDENINSMRDAIELFQETLEKNAHWFKQSQLFLLFNKKDLFAQKIASKSLAECFSVEQGYDEKEMYDDVEDEALRTQKNSDFVKQQFMAALEDDAKVVRSFETCAYQESEVEDVFGDILQNIVNCKSS